MIDLRRDVPQTGNALTALLGLAAVLGIIWLVSNAIAAESVRGVILLVAGIAAVTVAGKTLSDWRSGVYLFLIWLLFEDLVRKYMGNNMYIYFGKDVLIGVTYAALLMARSRGDAGERLQVPFKYALGLFFLWGLAEVFNPGSPSIWYGLLGLKINFYYIPLMFVGYGLVREERDLHRFLVVNMGLAAAIALVGIVQSIVGLDFLNPHSGEDIELLGHLVRFTPSGRAVPRPPSVFVSDGRFGAYLFIVFILGLGTAGYLFLRRRGSGRRIVFPALALVSVAGMMTGSRGAFVYFGATALMLSAGLLWGVPPNLGAGYRLVKAIRRSFVFVALALSLTVVLFPDVIGARWAFYRETVFPDSPDSETASRAWYYPSAELLKAFSDPDWVTGHGIGTASLGTQYVTRILKAPAVSNGLESGYGNLIVELGILGPVLWLLWTSSLVFSASKVVLKLKGTWAFPVALSIFWFAFLLLFPLTWASSVAYQNFITTAYLWLLVGILFRLPALVRSQSTVDLRQ